MKYIIITLLALTLTACSSLNPNTLLNATTAHAAFPSLSMAVSECLSSHPEVRERVKPDFNYLVSLWQEAGELDVDKDLLVVLANANLKLASAKASWSSIKREVVSAGVDCGPYVTAEVQRVEQTFTEIETAIKSNERIILAGQYAQLIARIVIGQRGQVVQMQ